MTDKPNATGDAAALGKAEQSGMLWPGTSNDQNGIRANKKGAQLIDCHIKAFSLLEQPGGDEHRSSQRKT
jgi:hypothetical protein